MKFGKGKDKTVIHYNDFITVRDIPLEGYDYVVNGKPAIEWVMERQKVQVIAEVVQTLDDTSDTPPITPALRPSTA